MKEGDVVVVDYVGRIKESGELFDTTKKEVAEEEDAVNERTEYKPIKIVVGAGMIVEGLDEALEDMEIGDSKEVEISPEMAFGKRKGNLIKTVSEKKFKDEEVNPYPGMRVTLDNRVGRVLSVNSGRVRVDLNHPLAGKTLHYKVEAKEMVTDEEEKVEAIVENYLGEDVEVEFEDKNAVVEIPKPLNKNIQEEVGGTIKEYTKMEDVEFKESGENEGEDKEAEQ